MVPLGVVPVIGFQLIFTYGAGFQYLFESEPLRGDTWLAIAAVGLVLFGLIELEKWLRGRILARRASALSPAANTPIM